jgi:hypothetical protein
LGAAKVHNGRVVCSACGCGEPQRGHYTHKQLLKMGVYYYSALYVPRSSPYLFGRLESIPLPTFEDPKWPVPDIATRESFRSKLHSDFLNSMRPNTSSKSTHIQWFMPCHAMVDLSFERWLQCIKLLRCLSAKFCQKSALTL